MSPTDTAQSTPKGTRIVRTALLLLGLLLVGYAVSDHPWYGGEPGFGAVQAVIAGLGVVVALGALLPVQWAQAALLWTTSSLLMLGVAEFAATLLLEARYRPIYQYDDRLLFRFIPSRSSVTTLEPINGGATVRHRINAQGYRGDELRPAGQGLRVAVYGDSFVHAYYTADGETFCAQLAAALTRRSGRAVEVVNAGVSSYGPDQVALKMQSELPQLRPDAVVVAIYAGNDYGDLLRNKLFGLAEDGRVVPKPWSLDPKVRMALEVSQRESILKRALRDLAQRWRPAAPAAAQMQGAGALDFLLDEAQREYVSAVVKPDNVVTNTHIDYYSADVSLTPDSPSARYKVQLMRGVMQKIRDIAAQQGVPLAFMFIPHRFDVADNIDWGPVDMQRFPRYAPRNQVAPLEQAASELGVPALSLFDTFRRQGAASMYLKGGDDHWNARGQQVAAEAMADYLGTLSWPVAARKP